MTRFYGLLAASEGTAFDPVHAARLDVEWWRAHRDAQDGRPGGRDELVGALRDLYVHVYSADPADVRRAAELRAQAMDVSDRWVAAGRDPHDRLLADERALLVRSYAALLAAVHR
jgi:hypothetical protein